MRKKKMANRVLSILISAILIFGLIPITAMAAAATCTASGVRTSDTLASIIDVPQPAQGTATATVGTKTISVALTSGSFGNYAGMPLNWTLGGGSALENPIISAECVDSKHVTLTLENSISASDDYNITMHFSVFSSDIVDAPFTSPRPVMLSGVDVCTVSTDTATLYSSLEAAIKNVVDGQTITLLKDIRSGGIAATDKSFTINLNGKTLCIDSVISDGIYADNGKVLSITGGGALNVSVSNTDQHWVGIQDVGAGSAILVDNTVACDVYVDGASGTGVIADKGGKIAFKGNVTSSTNENFIGVRALEGSVVTIDGNVSAVGCGVIAEGNAVITVTGNVMSIGHSIGANAYGGTITVGKNLSGYDRAAYAHSSGEVGGIITANGSVTSWGEDYVKIGDQVKLQSEYIVDSGYRVYTDGVSVVKAKISSSDCIVPDCTLSDTYSGFTEFSMIEGEKHYHITSAEQLAHVTKHPSLNYIQKADINLSDYNGGVWAPIEYFSGKYLGDGHRIDNLCIQHSSETAERIKSLAVYPDSALGLFAGIEGEGALVNGLTVTVSKSFVTGGDYACFGAVAGKILNGGVVEDCHVVYKGDVDTSFKEKKDIGGIAGYMSFAAIEGCSVTFESGSFYAGGYLNRAGGIAARSSSGTITNCDVIINADEAIRAPRVGGITGEAYSKSPVDAIVNCSVNGAGSVVVSPRVDCDYYVGGLVGYFGEGVITDCLNEVKVDATEVSTIGPQKQAFAGGLVGYLGSRSTITGCKNTGDVTVEIANNIANGGNGAYLQGDSIFEDAFAGGIAGYVYGYSNKATIENCENNANITAINKILGLRAYAGGIAGHIDSADGDNAGVDVLNCANIGADRVVHTEAGTTMTGGLFGSTSFHDFETANISITNCYNRSSVTSEGTSVPAKNGMCVGITAGGIIGAAGEVNVSNAYSTAKVISAVSYPEEFGADAYEGGLFGVLYMTAVSQNFYEETDEILRAVGAAGDPLQAPPDLPGSYEGATATELKTKSFYGNSWAWYTDGGTEPDYYSTIKPWRFTAASTYPVLKGLPYETSTPPSGGVYTATYKITATVNEGGMITPEGVTTLTQYSSKTYTITPGRGYKITDVMVDGVSVGAVKTYTFSSVTANHTIEAKFEHDCPSEPFTDIDITRWYHEEIDYVLLENLFKGTSATTFKPNSTMTRAMLVTVIHRHEGTPAAVAANPFADVASGLWYTDAVAWASEKGIVKGYDPDTFGPNDFVTREQVAAMLYRYAQFKGYDVSVGEDTNILSYEDAFDISEYAVPAIQWACGEAIMHGDGVRLYPRGNATRAEVAAVLVRFIENVVK